MLQIVVVIVSPNTQASRHKLSEQTGMVCVCERWLQEVPAYFRLVPERGWQTLNIVLCVPH